MSIRLLGSQLPPWFVGTRKLEREGCMVCHASLLGVGHVTLRSLYPSWRPITHVLAHIFACWGPTAA
jgi:hypothetical protein